MWAFNLSFLVFILFAQSSLFGQGLYIKPLQASGKLPSNEIYQIKQDPLGFIWVATELGLFQFDGIQFREWYCPQIGIQSISNIKIHSNGDLFCRDFNGGIFKKEGDSLRLIMQLSNAEPSGSIFTLDSAGNIWFVHQKMLQQCNPQGRIMRTISLQKTMRSRLVYDLIHWGNRIYWFDQVGDIGYYDFGNSIQGMLPAIESVVPHSYFCFISIANELFRFSFSAQDACYYLYSLENTMKLKIKVPFPGDIGRIHALNSEQNSLFINTTSGVYEFRMNQQELKFKTVHLASRKVSWTFKDREHQLWFATLHKGIYIAPYPNVIWYRNFPDNEITALRGLRDGNVLAGTYSGDVFELNYSTHRIHKFPEISEEIKFSVKNIYTDKDQIIVLRGKTDRYRTKQNLPTTLTVRNLCALEFDKDTIHAVFPGQTKVIESSEFDLMTSIRSPSDTLSGGYDVYCSPVSNHCYYALTSGLFFRTGGIWNELFFRGRKIITRDISGVGDTVFICTSLDGILIFNAGKLVFPDGIGTQAGFKISTIAGHYLFAASNQRVYQYDLRKMHRQPIQAMNIFNIEGIKVLEGTDSILWVGTGDGLLKVPIYSHFSGPTPELLIQEVRLNDSIIVHSELIKVPASFTSVEIEFSIANYRDRNNYLLEYLIPEEDTIWHAVDASTGTLRFNALPSGNLTLLMRVVSNSGPPSRVVQLNFWVATPWDKSPMLYTFLTLFIMSISVVLVRYRINQIKHKQALLTRTAVSQLVALKAQMNPHFIFNALNSLQSFILQNDVQKSNQFLSRFSTLMRDILQESGNTFIPLSKEIRMLSAYLEIQKVRFNDSFTFSISYDSIANPDEYLVPAMILQPIVENAVNHGINPQRRDNHISIQFILEKEFTIIIEDSGNDKPKDQNAKPSDYKSFGLISIQKRLELLKEITGTQCALIIHPKVEGRQDLGMKVMITFTFIPGMEPFRPEI